MRLSEVQPTDNEMRVLLEAGFVLREAGRFDEAENIFRGVMELLPASDVPLVGLSTVALQRGRFDESLALCEQALSLRPDSLYARVHHAESLLFQRRREEAEAELEEIISAHPESPHSRTARALLEAADLICATENQSDVPDDTTK